MDENRCKWDFPMVDPDYELRLVRVLRSECREQLATLEAKEVEILLSLGKPPPSEFMKTKGYEIEGVI